MDSSFFRGLGVFAAGALCLFAAACSGTSSTSSTSSPAPAVSLNPSSLTFSSQSDGTTSAAQSITLTNSGTAALTIASVSVTKSDFAISADTCAGASVAAKATCSIAVTFTPSTVGSESATLTIVDNASGSPHTAGLSGTGAADAPAVTLKPTSLSFSSQTNWTTSSAQTITLTNSGSAALSVSSITASGDFAETNNCTSSIAAGANCTISVTFTPTAAGTRSGTLTIADNAAGTPHTATLSGTGAAPQLASSCKDTSNKGFPSCFALSSPTAMAKNSSSSASRRVKSLSRRGRFGIAADASSGGFQTGFATDTAQIQALLNGTDTNPIATIGALGMTGLGSLIVSAPSTFICFGPSIYYANEPDNASGNPTYSLIPLNGWVRGGIWVDTDANTNGQVCSAAQLNMLMGASSNPTQMALAIAAYMNNYATQRNLLPTPGGAATDLTGPFNSAVQAALQSNEAGPFTVIDSATIGLDPTGMIYAYTITFTGVDFGDDYTGTITLTQTTTADPNVYSGLLYVGLTDSSNDTPNHPPYFLAGTVRYNRSSATSLDVSARSSYYDVSTNLTNDPTIVDANGDLDPTYPNWDVSFSRFAASFDPTSPWLAGNFVFAQQMGEWYAYGGPNAFWGPNANSPSNVLQVVVAGDGTGAAFWGQSDAITQDDSWEITHMDCGFPGTWDHPLYAEYQPFEFDSTAGMYVPSSTIQPMIRYAPTVSCAYTEAQWNGGVPTGYWYDRALQYSADPGKDPSTLIPSTIDESVVAQPGDANFPLSLFGDGVNPVQDQINTLTNFTEPTLY